MNSKVCVLLVISILAQRFFILAVPVNKAFQQQQQQQGNSSSSSQVREKRFAGAAVGHALKKVALRAGADFIVWTGILTSVNAIDAEYKNNLKNKNIEKRLRARSDCKTFNFGCIENLCWTNCGPRLNSDDWCITTPPEDRASVEVEESVMSNNNKTIRKSKKTTFASCFNDADCDPCWKCGGTCVLQGGPNIHALLDSE